MKANVFFLSGEIETQERYEVKRGLVGVFVLPIQRKEAVMIAFIAICHDEAQQIKIPGRILGGLP